MHSTMRKYFTVRSSDRTRLVRMSYTGRSSVCTMVLHIVIVKACNSCYSGAGLVQDLAVEYRVLSFSHNAAEKFDNQDHTSFPLWEN